MAKQLHHIEIHPGDNGGHRVIHEFEREMGKKDGVNGGMYMEHPKPEEHLFGPSEDHKVLPHVGKALGFKEHAGTGPAEHGGRITKQPNPNAEIDERE